MEDEDEVVGVVQQSVARVEELNSAVATVKSTSYLRENEYDNRDECARSTSQVLISKTTCRRFRNANGIAVTGFTGRPFAVLSDSKLCHLHRAVLL